MRAECGPRRSIPGVIMSKTRFAFVVPLIVVLFGNGCSASTTTSLGQAAVYVLASIDGHALPARLNSSDEHAPRVVWETLSLDGNGTATRSRTIIVASPAVEEASTLTYRYVVTDGFLTLGDHLCGPADICTDPESGALVGGTLTLTVPGSATAPVLVYQRRNIED
jgi:hypothetical protein